MSDPEYPNIPVKLTTALMSDEGLR